MSMINRVFPELRRAMQLLEHEPLFRPMTRFPAFPLADQPRAMEIPTDIKETDKEYVVEMEVPGMSKDQISLEFVGDCLKVSGKYESQGEGRSIQSERVMGEFERVMRFPMGVDTGNSHASLKDGVLRVSIPKHDSVTQKLMIE